MPLGQLSNTDTTRPMKATLASHAKASNDGGGRQEQACTTLTDSRVASVMNRVALIPNPRILSRRVLEGRRDAGWRFEQCRLSSQQQIAGKRVGFGEFVGRQGVGGGGDCGQGFGYDVDAAFK